MSTGGATRRKFRWGRWLAGTALAALVAAPAHALRCGQKVIAEGDHAVRVLRFCGEPTAVETRLARRLHVGDIEAAFFPALVNDVLVEEWTYNFGPRRLMRVVTVEAGIVTDIRTLGYGFSPY